MNKERWEQTLKQDHVRVAFAQPRSFVVVAVGEKKSSDVVEADEILLPISKKMRPDHIWVRAGARYRAFAKFRPDSCFLLQKVLPPE